MIYVLKSNFGFSLVEILISLILLSLLLMGIDIMQVDSLREVSTAYYSSIANQQLQNMAEYLAMIKDNNVNDYITLWNKQNLSILPQGKGVVTGAFPSYVISIFWGENNSFGCRNKLGQAGCLNLEVSITK